MSNAMLGEIKYCETCDNEKQRSNYYLCSRCEDQRNDETKDIQLIDIMDEFKHKSDEFERYLVQDYEEIRSEYPYESFGDESFLDFIDNTITATYNLEDDQ